MDDNNYEYLKKSILKLSNIDLDNYKPQQMRRRLDMFFNYSKFNDVASYVSAMQRNPELLAKLRDFLTINVSEFFRDKPLFDYLQNVVIPDLLRKSPSLNIWSAGCSRGEEPYSLAMILSNLSPGQQHRILATDIDDNSLSKAKGAGPYSLGEIKDIPPDIIKRYFTVNGSEVMVTDKIKRMVEIRRHDLLNDGFERDFDLIICRNVVIYFTENTKRALNERFFNSLKRGGVLFIGGTEVMLESSAIGFSQIAPFFYRKPDNCTTMPVSVAARV